MIDVYLGLGSNIGDREQQLQSAVERLDQVTGIHVQHMSSMYETKPVGYVEQPDFLNVCLHIKTTLSPEALLHQCLRIEKELHRVREVRWGPRTIDIDVLLYGDEIIESEQLIVPHPRMTARAFVMIPLNEIAAHVIEPRSKKTIQSLVQPDETVVKYQN
ncbi:2-amino-4-hydroxy-6-hydroxymethyldihydropteridine diphosphokinase [Staphylococcus hyicus]|uniref:2-amino-4-hydroxy-6-hydroxymethyldihydropteridine diphosphokinase n=2 Tax=Staphylococcus hyicus TaxID=1284 RepID=A0ACD5FKA9_STAHY|nr:2-amino-4-hydroxy-6-hydroxymethyldihydropteridine diphosphokinase [Staphylococcus hyicus]AJC96942.1 2-amino-4-hydroxy-6- hydroxymethyldihydropteridine pyrophosphokinase [Staphylococcus hyicus]MCE5154978.1 2-amino-4-hydroxy-6-hydroxymethyldihydropteridine diphosphokinase [Staphylococcus hyicus]MDP4449723.1 2-amino-4-hydroxy-6-hydroxymethyldihydropteridine diphosphokinase [Staphylococcus hyicus]MDP4461980.1 2-amino-4-hydroxy-6-hydroxymethyldihydropteridine diphosphokinase [Staphylococcus hyicu